MLPTKNHDVATYREKVIQLVLATAAMVSAAAVAAICGFLLYFCLPLADWDKAARLLTWVWQPMAGHFGILPMVAGTLALSFSALALAYPAGIGVASFALGLGPRRLQVPVMALVRAMTSVPTVVYGFASVFVLVPLLRRGIVAGSGYCWLAAMLALALLVLPTIVLVVHQQLRINDDRLALTAEALGIGRAERLVFLALPLSRPGLVIALVLGAGRALGDTLIALMLSGNAPLVPTQLGQPLRTLTAHIALVVATDSQSLAYQSLFAAGLILMAVSLMVNLGVRLLDASGGSSKT